MSRIALDTNVLVYAEGFDDPEKAARAKAIMGRLDLRDVVVPVQVLGELHRVIVGKHGRTPADARIICERWSDTYVVRPTTETAFVAALRIAGRHGVRIWDAIIISVAAEAGCRILLSEDVFLKAKAPDVTIVNPFSARSHGLLADLIGEG